MKNNLWNEIFQKGREDFFSIFNGAKSIIVFDTETTGLGSDAKIIEFAAVRYENCPSGLKETAKMISKSRRVPYLKKL